MSASSSNSGAFDRVRQELDRWLDTARVTGERALDAVGLATDNRPMLPAIDVLENETDVHVIVDLPGVAADAVELALVGQMLKLNAQRPAPAVLTEATKIHGRERHTLQFERSIALPVAIDADSIRAVVRDGLLHITLHKRPDLQARPIPVHRATET